MGMGAEGVDSSKQYQFCHQFNLNRFSTSNKKQQMLRCFSFTAPLNVKLWKRREWAKKQKRREIKRQKGKIQRKGKESKQFSVSVITILGAKLSNYWLELLKKLITGSHRLCNRQTRLDLRYRSSVCWPSHHRALHHSHSVLQQDSSPPTGAPTEQESWLYLLRSPHYLCCLSLQPQNHMRFSPSVLSFIVPGSHRRQTVR